MNSSIKFGLINLYQCDKGFATNERFLDFHYFLYVHSGKGTYRIGKKDFIGKTGDLFYCPPMTGNTILADSEDPFLLSGLEFKVINDKSTDQFMRDKLSPEINIQRNSFLRQSIDKMIEECTYNRIYSNDICSSLLTSFIYSVIRMTEAKETDSTETSLEIMEYIKAGIDRDINHKELSEVFSYHKSSINRMLIAATGMSLKNYQLDLRIKKAMELLTYSTKPQSDIAALCGYKSSVFFSRQFKEKTGFTPTEYRRRR